MGIIKSEMAVKSIGEKRNSNFSFKMTNQREERERRVDFYLKNELLTSLTGNGMEKREFLLK